MCSLRDSNTAENNHLSWWAGNGERNYLQRTMVDLKFFDCQCFLKQRQAGCQFQSSIYWYNCLLQYRITPTFSSQTWHSLCWSYAWGECNRLPISPSNQPKQKKENRVETKQECLERASREKRCAGRGKKIFNSLCSELTMAVYYGCLNMWFQNDAYRRSEVLKKPACRNKTATRWGYVFHPEVFYWMLRLWMLRAWTSKLSKMAYVWIPCSVCWTHQVFADSKVTVDLHLELTTVSIPKYYIKSSNSRQCFSGLVFNEAFPA